MLLVPVVYFAEPVKIILRVIWAGNMQSTLDSCTDHQGRKKKITATSEKLKAYCPSIYTV